MSSNIDNQMDQEFYNNLTYSVEIFLKENNAKWKMDYHAMREYKGEEEVSKSNTKVITAELTVDYYETWANFHNFMSYSFCGLSTSNKKDHYFKETQNHTPTKITGDSDLTYNRITKLIAEFGFVDELNIKHTYKIVINFEKGQ